MSTPFAGAGAGATEHGQPNMPSWRAGSGRSAGCTRDGLFRKRSAFSHDPTVKSSTSSCQSPPGCSTLLACVARCAPARFRHDVHALKWS
jgi:hypothetical protein